MKASCSSVASPGSWLAAWAIVTSGVPSASRETVRLYEPKRSSAPRAGSIVVAALETPSTPKPSDAQINTDRNLKLQFLAGLGLNLYQSDAIYQAMKRDAKYPEGLFEGSPETLQLLRARIDANLGGRSF